MKGLTGTKIGKEIRFEWIWGELDSEKFPETMIYKIFEINSSFYVKYRTTGKV